MDVHVVGHGGGVVHFSESVDIDEPALAVGDRLITDERLLRVGPGDPLLKRTVEVVAGPPCPAGSGAIAMPIRWHDRSHPRWFPTLAGDLVVTPLDEGHCRLSFVGSYEPPGGSVGRVVDDVLLHGVAESTIRAFLRQLAAGLRAAEQERD